MVLVTCVEPRLSRVGLFSKFRRVRVPVVLGVVVDLVLGNLGGSGKGLEELTDLRIS